jgi:hypothetical protein
MKPKCMKCDKDVDVETKNKCLCGSCVVDMSHDQPFVVRMLDDTREHILHEATFYPNVTARVVCVRGLEEKEDGLCRVHMSLVDPSDHDLPGPTWPVQN